ncbi:MAG: Fe-S cluster assembly ATPase SufC [Acidimicrobiales bacterium]
MTSLVISDLHASVAGSEILRGINLSVGQGEVHAVMGPNGSGKSTLSHVLAGKPGYTVTSGSVTLGDLDLLALPAWERAQAGLYLAMQYPTEVPGVSVEDMLVAALAAANRDSSSVAENVLAESERIGLDVALLDRSLNVDLSGGEKKRNETLQLGILKPVIAVLDELDSGLDVDALRACSRRVEQATQEFNMGVLAITHYTRLLQELHADEVHILVVGRIVESGGPELAVRLESEGYDKWVEA